MVQLAELRLLSLVAGGQARSWTQSWYTLSILTERGLSTLMIKGSNLFTESLVVSLVTILTEGVLSNLGVEGSNLLTGSLMVSLVTMLGHHQSSHAVRYPDGSRPYA